MTQLAWTDAMSVGVPALDTDHRCLVRIIGLLEDVGDESVKHVVENVLESLSTYCRFHFAREERVMEACGFPEIEFHRGEHADFTRYVTGLRNRYGRNNDKALANELLYQLISWLWHHIMIQDMAYKPFVSNAELPLDTLDGKAPPVLLPRVAQLSA